MITSENYKYKLARKMIDKFVEEFKEKTGMKATVMTDQMPTYKDKDFMSEFVSLESFEEAFIKCYPVKFDNPNFLTLKTRKRQLVEARCVFCYIARQRIGFTVTSIAKALGKDHTTVLHMVTRANNLLETEEGIFCSLYDKTIENLKLSYDKTI